MASSFGFAANGHQKEEHSGMPSMVPSHGFRSNEQAAIAG